MEQGLVQIYCGDGKGKTTAAIGQLVRAAGRHYKCLFTQFLKSDDSGERRILEQLGEVVLTPCPQLLKFSFQMNEEEKAEQKTACTKLFGDAAAAAMSCYFDVIVLDEILGAIECGFLEEDLVLDFLNHKPQSVEVVLTGRKASQALTAKADYVSCITQQKHPFEQGIGARKGIEY